MRSNHYTVFPNAPKVRLGDYIMRSTVNNRDEKYGIELIEGVTNEGVFASPKGNPLDVDLKPYKIVKTKRFQTLDELANAVKACFAELEHQK